jgi:hypothetical protein
MKRKALLIGNTRGLNATPIDMFYFAQFLMSYQGGAWNVDELVPWLDKSAGSILNEIETIKGEKNDYVIVYFTGHGALQGDTILEVNPSLELLKENSFFGLAERQLNILDCCRCTKTTPLGIYGSSRGMTPMELALREEVRNEYETMVMEAAPQLVRLYSCTEGESSFSSNTSSYYTTNLLFCAKTLLSSNRIVHVHQCHDTAALKTTDDVHDSLKKEQHPVIIPTKCISQAELPFSINPIAIKQ